MNEQKLKTVQQWRTALQEAARTAVEALAFETPINKAVPSLDERSEILGAAIHKIRELVRTEPKTVAFLEEEAWYRMKGAETLETAGAYFTPKSALDFVMANPPLNIPPADEPIDPNAPKLVPGEKPFTRLSLVNIPEINIEFHNFYTDDFYMAVCYWENKDGERRVYEITVKPWAATGTSKWRARAQVCGKVLFYLEGASKCLVIECALVAMRRYLIRSHRCAWRTARRLAKQQAYNSKAAEPLSPEDELADTIKRQKEAEAL